MLQIKHSSGASFDLFPDTKLSIEETSVFFGKDGAFSLPLDLPNTDNNLSLLGFPYRIDRKSKFITDLNVQISAGTWLRSARMEVQSARRDDKITVELYFSESKFYRQIDNKVLADVFKNVREEGVGSSLLEKVNYLWLKLNNVAGGAAADYHVFPVLVQKNDKKVTASGGFTLEAAWSEFIILNRQGVPRKDGTEGSISTNAGGVQYYGLGTMRFDNPRLWEANTFNYPMGYGHTPFLKFSYVIHRLFQFFGYNLQQSIFDTDAAFKKLVLLNNTADAIVNGYIDYSQLVPDVSVSDFLSFVENSFGCEFVFDDIHKSVTPVFWKDILLSSSVLSLNNKVEDYPLVNLSRSKSLRLTFEHSLPELVPLEFNTYGEVIAKYGNIKGEFDDLLLFKQEAALGNLNGLYLIKDIGMLYVCFRYEHDPLNNPGVYDYVTLPVEKDTLDFGSSSFENEERNMNFFMPAMLRIPMRGETLPVVKATFDKGLIPLEQWTEQAYNDYFGTDPGIIANMPYINSIRHLNSIVVDTVKEGDVEKTKQSKEEDRTDCPIIPCFYTGIKDKVIHGSVYSSGLFSISALSLYNAFWQKYNDALKSSFHTVEGRAFLSESEIKNIAFDKACSLDSQNVMIESIQYEVSNTGLEVVNLKLRTIKNYQ